MRKIHLLATVISIFLAVLLFNSCKDKSYIVLEANVPIYQTKSEWRNTTFSFRPAEGIEQAGKIYIYDDMLLVVEPNHGVHFYDNSNTTSPMPLGWIEILGCSDVSIRNNVLYVNSLMDLVAINIADLNAPEEVGRIEDVFRYGDYQNLPGYNEDYPMGTVDLEEDQVIIGWEVKKTKMESTPYYGHYYNTFEDAVSLSSSGGEFGNATGLGGSMARFSIVNDFLYTLLDNQLESYQLAGDGSMSKTSEVQVTRWCETLFGTTDHLFLGTTSGMVVYDIANPSSPTFTSEIDHITACDPVVVSGDRAYITLSSGTGCWGVDQLEVIDINNIQTPEVLAQYSMDNPKGLGVENHLLFVCDGLQGVRIFDRTDDYQILNNPIASLPVVNAMDVIPYNKNLIITSEDGIYQYDYQDVNNIHLSSHIPLNL